MRFLILAYSYKPMTNPRAIRWSAIAEYWAQNGHDVDVVCGWQPGLARDEFLEGVHLHRAGGNFSERFRSHLRPPEAPLRAERADSEATPFVRKATCGQMLRKLARTCHDLTWKKLYWPDASCLWSIPATKTARSLLEHHDYDAVISVSIPFTSHLIGYRLRDSMNRAAWLVDSGDPFSFLNDVPPNNTSIYRRTNRAWEHKVFQAASNVSVTTTQTAARYRELFPDCAKKIVVIPPLAQQFDRNEGSLPENNTGAKPTKLVFAGTLYRTIRNPQFLFKLFDQLLCTTIGDRLELHLYGLLHDCRDLVERQRFKYGKRLCIHGPVSVPEARSAIRDADILVNIGNSTACQLPSKVVEYAATGKPILNLSSIADDSSAAFLKGHPATLTLLDSGDEHLTEQVEQAGRFMAEPPPVDRMKLERWLDPYRVAQVAAMYESLLCPAAIPLRTQPGIREAA